MLKEHKKLERLMLFSEVAEHLSFTVAAERLGISRGHLSAQIRRLEKDMGMVLLIRSTRSVKLTAEGKKVLSGMNRIRHDLLALERSAESQAKDIEGQIKITAPAVFSQRFLFEIFDLFKLQHPKIQFSLDCSYTRFDLNKSNFDLAFRSTHQPPQNMVAKHILSYQLCCCASPEYIAKNGQPQSPKALETHQCLRGNDQPTWEFNSSTVNVSGWLEVNDNQMLKSLALQGKGIIRVPSYLVDNELSKGKLIQVLHKEMPKESQIYMINPLLIHQPKRLSTFIEFTRKHFTQLA